MVEFFTVLAVILAIFLLLVLLLLSLKGTLTIAYDKELSVSFRVLCFKIMLYPRPPKKQHKRRRMSRAEAAWIRKLNEKKEAVKTWIKQKLFSKAEAQKKESPKKEPKKEEATTEIPKPPIGKTVSLVVDIIAALTEATAITVKRFAHHLRIKVARLHVKIASEDAALTAVAYGSVTQIINVLLPILSTVKNFKLPKEKDLDISVDFSTTVPEVDAEISFSLRVWHLADVGLRALIGGFMKFAKRNDSLEDVLAWIFSLIFNKEEKEPKTENN